MTQQNPIAPRPPAGQGAVALLRALDAPVGEQL